MSRTTSMEEFERELQGSAAYRKAERKIRPYYEIALAIIKRRLSLGLTQEELAEKAGTHQSRISKIESSEHDIRLSTLINIADALDAQLSISLIPTAEIFYPEEQPYYVFFNTGTDSQALWQDVPRFEWRYSTSLSVQGSS